jgi:hypothetical protein
MPKATVFEKKGNKNGSVFSDQKDNEFSVWTTSVSIANPELVELRIDSQKTNENKSKIGLQPNISRKLKFDEYLIEAIDEALTSLGAPVKNTLYFQLENNFGMPKNEIPKQIESFIEIIHKIFGLGASRLEIKFMKNLHSKIKVNFEMTELEWPLSKWIVEDMSFTDYICSARNNYCNMNIEAKRLAIPENRFSNNLIGEKVEVNMIGKKCENLNR